MNFVSIKRFADLKKCSRETVYNAAKRGKINIDRTSGIPIIYLSKKNLDWKPGQEMGRPREKSIDFITSEIKKNIKRKL